MEITVAALGARCAAMASHDLFEPDVCTVASGWEKGRVEKGVQDARRRIWQEAEHERVGSVAELNAWLAGQCRAVWAAPHPDRARATGSVPTRTGSVATQARCRRYQR